MAGIEILICAVAGVIGLIVLAIAAYVVMTYNRFVGLRNGVENSFKQIQVSMKKRFDMIGQLVDSTGSYIKYEKELMTDVTKLRSAPLGNPADVKNADAMASGLLGRIFAVMESYPNPRGMEAVANLQGAIKDVENEISRLRYLYNDQVQTYNTMTERIPSNFIASVFGFVKKEYLQFGEEIEKRPDTKFY